MKSIILILGTSRSGSTMLDLMLGNDEKTISCGEAYAYFHPWRKSHRNPKCICLSGNDCEIFNRMKQMQKQKFHINCLYTFEKEHIIDSSKELSWIIDVNIDNLYRTVDLKNILIYKNPIDLAYSYFKRGRGLLSWRKEFVCYHNRLFEASIPFYSINYNSFVESVDANLQQLCKILNLTWFSARKEFWNREYHHFFGSKGTRDQIKTKSCVDKNQYSPAFLEHIDILQEKIDNDADIQRILKILRKYDFKKAYNSHKPLVERSQFQIHKPLFYYSAVIKRYIYYLFPRSEPHA